MTFYVLLNVILPDNPKAISMERQDTILIGMIIGALVIPGVIVWAVEQYANPFWSLILGFVGVGLVVVNVMCSKRLHFKQQSIKLGFRAACCCQIKVDRKEVYMLIGAVIGTFAFVVIPALLADAGYANWAGIVANAPKITVLGHDFFMGKETSTSKTRRTERIKTGNKGTFNDVFLFYYNYCYLHSYNVVERNSNRQRRFLVGLEYIARTF